MTSSRTALFNTTYNFTGKDAAEHVQSALSALRDHFALDAYLEEPLPEDHAPVAQQPISEVPIKVVPDEAQSIATARYSPPRKGVSGRIVIEYHRPPSDEEQQIIEPVIEQIMLDNGGVRPVGRSRTSKK